METAKEFPDSMRSIPDETEASANAIVEEQDSLNSNAKLSALIRKVERSEISSIKQVVSKLVEIINDPDSSAKELKEVIEKDPPLSARLLKMANSAFYGLRRKVCVIQEAIVCIGFNAVKELAMSQKVSEVFQGGCEFEGYSRPRLWEHSLAVAVCSKLIYKREFRMQGEEIYVAGLLHDLGIIAEDQFLHDEFEAVVAESKKSKENLPKVENQRLQFDHADVGRIIADKWDFPHELVRAIGSHHNPEVAAGELKRVILTLFVSDYVCQRNEIGYCDAPYKKDEPLYYKCLKELDIKGVAMNLIVEDVQKEISELKSAGWL